ncbi:uncharacterized protein BDV17DRAFT_296109 [Aspergillus undulatus]|uniref:uncharacterized protein n=1 Tax=Aspergillus undulatus TaxID=1810928 RepID=UPI003CCDCFFC
MGVQGYPDALSEEVIEVVHEEVKPKVEKSEDDQPQFKGEFVALSKVDPEFASLFANAPFSSGGFFTGAPFEDLRTHIYRLAPGHPFPQAPEDIWDSVKWVAQHATLLGSDPSKGFILGGVSAGRHLTTIIAQLAAKEQLQPPLTGHWVPVPVLLGVVDEVPP